MNSLSILVKEYELKNIYNLDESALFYRLQPNRSLATRAVSGVKTSKERVSIGVCANADGSDKRRLIVIGRYAKPRCFGNFDPNSVVDYFHNAKAWMTSIIFNAWLSKFNKKMACEKRNVLLLLDNASSHKIVGEYSNIKIHFLPPNTTSVLQPMDAGINKLVLPNLKDAIIMIQSAWTKVTSETIKNCFNHCKYFNNF
ncbi:unnamed protein product, partial [Brachionus calyciflorus]